MDPTARLLEAETMKWLARLEEKLAALPGKASQPARSQLVNVTSYVSDSRHFLDARDYVRAFEAVIYAWGIYETLERLQLISAADGHDKL